MGREKSTTKADESLNSFNTDELYITNNFKTKENPLKVESRSFNSYTSNIRKRCTTKTKGRKMIKTVYGQGIRTIKQDFRMRNNVFSKQSVRRAILKEKFNTFEEEHNKNKVSITRDEPVGCSTPENLNKTPDSIIAKRKISTFYPDASKENSLRETSFPQSNIISDRTLDHDKEDLNATAYNHWKIKIQYKNQDDSEEISPFVKANSYASPKNFRKSQNKNPLTEKLIRNHNKSKRINLKSSLRSCEKKFNSRIQLHSGLNSGKKSRRDKKAGVLSFKHI